MKSFKTKLFAIGLLILAGAGSQVGAQEGYRPTQSNLSATRQSYNAPIGVQQNRRSIKEQINPCNTNYGVVMDGWHDAMLLTTVKSIEWWFSFVCFIALLVVGFDDLHRMRRAKEVLEATSGAAQIWLNDRSYCLTRANEAIGLYNKVILAGNTPVLRTDTMNPPAPHLASPSVIGPAIMSDREVAEVGDSTRNERADPVGAFKRTEQAPVVDLDAEKGVHYSTFEVGGKKYRVPTPVRLSAQANIRKIENQRIKINELEERLSKYEKD